MMKKASERVLPCLLVFVLILAILPANTKAFEGEHEYHSEAITGEALIQDMPLIMPFARTIITMDRTRDLDSIVQMAKLLTHSGFDFYKTTRYESTPNFTNPYAAGSLNAYDIADALNTVKMVRYIAGLPYEDIQFTDTLNNIAQHGAVLLAASNQFSHYPTKPADMYQEFFDLGYLGCSKSNISAGRSNISNAILAGFIADSGDNNIEHAGHRRWILKPGAQDFGIGFARNTASGVLYSGSRVNMYVSDNSLTSTFESDSYIAWPSSGDFPIQYFTASTNLNFAPPYPWSINLGEAYQTPNRSEITLTLTRTRDNKTWIFNSATPQLGVGNMPNDSMHLAVDNVGYGIGKAIIFRPDLTSLGAIQDGDVFNVSISGIKTPAGAATTLNYSINFFDLEKEMNRSRVNITVKHGTTPVQGATVVIDGQTLTTDSNGLVTLRVTNNAIYNYTVTCSGYNTESGILNVGADEVSIDVPVYIPVEFTITDTDKTYNGTSQTVAVAANPAVAYTVTYDGSTAVPKDAGTYSVSVEATAAGYSGSKTTIMTIDKADITVAADNGIKKIGNPDPPLTTTITSGQLFHGDSFGGELIRDVGEGLGTYAIKRGTLELSANYNMTFLPAVFTIIEKYPQDITVTGLSDKTYGDVPFSLTVTPDSSSQLDNISFNSSNTDVAEIDINGEITIKGSGTTVITVTEPGDTDYAPFSWTQELVVSKKALNIINAAIEAKVFDATTSAIVNYIEFDGIVGSDTLTLGTDFTTAASYDSPNAEDNKSVGVEVTLTDTAIANNYSLSESGYTLTGQSIAKAVITPDALSHSIQIYYEEPSSSNMFNPANLLPTDKGATTYSVTSPAAPSSIVNIALNNGVLSFDTSEATIGDIEDITIKAIMENYSDIVISVHVEFVDKKIPLVSPEISGNLTYGQTLSVLTITASAVVDETLAVSGTITWDNPTSKPLVASHVQAWTFTPDNTELYKSVHGFSEVSVNKAEPSGIPTITRISADDKTLTDANLTLPDGGFKNPYDDTIVSGTLAWDDADSTIVIANTNYSWAYTPDDTANYSTVTGTFKPYESFSITATAASGGTVSGGGTYAYGDTVTLSAAANSGYTFNGWYEGAAIISMSAVYTFTATTNRSIEARFNYISTGGGGGGGIGGGGGGSGGGSGGGGSSGGSSGTSTSPSDNTIRLNGKAVDLTPNVDGSISISADVMQGFTTAVILAMPFEGSSNSHVGVIRRDGRNIIIPFSKRGSMIMLISEPGTYAVIDNKKYFSDIEGHWAAETIDFISARELFSGIGGNKFDPNGGMTRAMFAQVLANIESPDLSLYTSSRFSDVDTNAWYAPAVEWAAAMNIVGGYGNAHFGPNDLITREQMAVILNNYMDYKGITLNKNYNYVPFADAYSISAWAEDAVEDMQCYGLISGVGNNYFAPLDTANRAGVAQLFRNLIEAYLN